MYNSIPIKLFVKRFLSLVFKLVELETWPFSIVFKFSVQVFCSSFLFKFFVQVFCSSFLFKYFVQNLVNLFSCKIKLYDKIILSPFFNFLNLKTDLLVLCSSSLFKSFVQIFCSSIVFKALKTFAGVKSNYDKRIISLVFELIELETDLGSCIILFQSNYLLKEVF